MTINLPVQSPRFIGPTDLKVPLRIAGGVQAAQTPCDGLTGLAQQMCYAVLYSV